MRKLRPKLSSKLSSKEATQHRTASRKAQIPKKKKTSKKYKPHQPHQRHYALFYEFFAITELFRELLSLALSPEQLDLLDLNSLKLEDNALPSVRGYSRWADLVFSVNLKSNPRQAKVKNQKKLQFKINKLQLALLVEHKSTSDHGLPLQVFIYTAGLRQKFPSVIPIVVTQGGELPSSLVADAGRKALGLEAIKIPFIHLDLATIKSEKLAPLTCAAALVILGNVQSFDKKPRKQQEGIILEALSHLDKLKKHHEALLKKLVYYVKCESPAMSKLLYSGPKLVGKRRKLAKKLKGGFKIMQDAKNLWFDENKYVNKGLIKGQKLGLVKGRQEGQQEMIQLMLKRAGLKEVSRLTGFSVQKLQKLRKKAS